MNSPMPLEIDVATVKARLDRQDDFLLLDIREPDERAVALIAAAQAIPMNHVPERIQELEPYRTRDIVVHCHHGVRSLRMTNWLRSQGFLQVQSMAGGIHEWSALIDPAVPQY